MVKLSLLLAIIANSMLLGECFVNSNLIDKLNPLTILENIFGGGKGTGGQGGGGHGSGGHGSGGHGSGRHGSDCHEGGGSSEEAGQHPGNSHHLKPIHIPAPVSIFPTIPVPVPIIPPHTFPPAIHPGHIHPPSTNPGHIHPPVPHPLPTYKPSPRPLPMPLPTPLPEPDFSELNIYDINRRLRDSDLHLLGLCLYQLSVANPLTNKLTSLVSFYLTLCHLGLYTKQPILKKMLILLNLKSRPEMIYTMRKLMTEFNREDGNFTSQVAFEMYTDEDDSFCYDFTSSYNKYLKGRTAILDYGKPEQAAYEINTWANKQISSISDIISPNRICKGNGLMVISTFSLSISFSGYVFSGQMYLDFYNSKTDIIKTTAWTGHGPARFAFVAEIKASVYEIPMSNGYSMIIIHPRHPEDLIMILDQLRDPQCFNRVLFQLKHVYLDLCIPLRESYNDYNDNIKGLRTANILTEIAEPSFNGFEGIYDSGKSGYVSQMLHEILFRIKGLPVGCEINASPNFGTKCPEGQIYKKGNVNSPFIVYLMDAEKAPIIAATEYCR